jgi:hypothetical protein
LDLKKKDKIELEVQQMKFHRVLADFSWRHHIRTDIIWSQLAEISIMEDTERDRQQWRPREMTTFFLGGSQKICSQIYV